ncbi:MAG: SOS response-associated peptidase family protein [Rhodocyclaceae bacterium]|nr:SOS response-associated peptidase family protein [Rhodocyclaceae bacterium]MBX3678048.1 SOS response-associated peptidase family protein [Rhodocyclaceae bacterium]
MCGRFTLHTPQDQLIEHFGLASCLEFGPRYNIAPTSDMLVIRHRLRSGARRPGGAMGMVAYPVGMAVNRAGAEGAELISRMPG